MLCLLIVILLSTGVIYCASVLSNTKLLWIQQLAGHLDDGEESLDLSMQQVLALPVTTSIMLILLFYYFKYLQYLLLLMLASACGYSLYDNSLLLLKLCGGPAAISKWYGYVSCAVSVVVVYKWIGTSHYLYLDALALSLAVTFISTVRFPSLRIATVCLLALFIYDVFWVFFSERFFRENVMVAVATRDAESPVHVLHSYNPDNHIIALLYRLFSHMSPSIVLPLKIVIPALGLGGRDNVMLGLGDISLPGLLIALAYRHDFDYPCYSKEEDEELALPAAGSGKRISVPRATSFASRKVGDVFEWSLLAYTTGLCLAFYCSFTFQHAQPALLYIVPCVLGAISARARYTGRLRGLWTGDDGSDGSSGKR